MLFTFICSKLFGQLLDTSLKFTLIQSLYIRIWFTDQRLKSLETGDKINIALVINWRKANKKWCKICVLLKIWVKTLAVNTDKNVSIKLNNMLQMRLKLLHKEYFKKQQKQLVIWLEIKLLRWWLSHAIVKLNKENKIKLKYSSKWNRK